jgi:hypothetical protein
MEAKLHLYVGGNVEARLDVAPFIPLRCSPVGKGEGMVKHRLDRAANVEPELCLRLALAPSPPRLIELCKRASICYTSSAYLLSL